MKKTIFLITFTITVFASDLELQVVSTGDVLIANINQNDKENKDSKSSNDNNLVVMPLEVMVDKMTIPVEAK